MDKLETIEMTAQEYANTRQTLYNSNEDKQAALLPLKAILKGKILKLTGLATYNTWDVRMPFEE